MIFIKGLAAKPGYRDRPRSSLFENAKSCAEGRLRGDCPQAVFSSTDQGTPVL
jgi:hypothetical protein